MDERNLLKENAFAVVQLKPGTETRLLRVLIEHGYNNVSFTNANGELIDMNENDNDNDDEGDQSDVDIDIENDPEPIRIQIDAKSEREWSTKQSMDDRLIHMQKAISLIDQSKPLEFSSLTLPTVLLSEQPQYGYNPYLALPFLPFLPRLDQRLKTELPCTCPSEIMPARSWNAPTPQAHMMDTPPSTPRGSSSSHATEQNCLINGAKLRQRGRQLRRNERDTSSYASCRLCRNRILANRLSNLHNHVRRHALLKQFHCCYCTYAHTEVAKVRLHMLHNHKDDRTQPLDKRNEDMEAAWNVLMKECFPAYV